MEAIRRPGKAETRAKTILVTIDPIGEDASLVGQELVELFLVGGA